MSGGISKDDLNDIKKNQATNLRFLDKFIKTMKWSKPQFAEKIGMTKANVYHWFKVDDMLLTRRTNQSRQERDWTSLDGLCMIMISIRMLLLRS